MNSVLQDLNKSGKTEENEVGSVNHALVQTRLIRALPGEKFVIATELSLDVSSLEKNLLGSLGIINELKPDICLYPIGTLKFIKPVLGDDIVRYNLPPVTSIEIVSPSQSSQKIVAKFRAYFAFGVKTCWLVEPVLEVVSVYTSMSEHRIFSILDGEVVDDEIRVSIAKIFE